LLEYVDFNIEAVRKNALSINPKLNIFEISCKTEEGIENWSKWLLEEVQNK